MPATETQFATSRLDTPKPTGPKAPEGQERSRVDTPRPGPIRVGTVLPEWEAAEVKRRQASFRNELRPSCEVGLVLVDRAATLSVRMERCVELENAALTDRVRRAIADFIPPEGADAAEVARLRAEAGTRAMFDPSKEAAQARRYEAAAERGFFRALKELRLVEKAARAAEREAEEDFLEASLGSFLPEDDLDAEFAALEREFAPSTARQAVGPGASSDFGGFGGRSDVPFTIGRVR